MRPADILDRDGGALQPDARTRTTCRGRAKALGHTPHEIMTIASIVQAESGSKQDMPKVARVIYNRLDRQPPMTQARDGQHGHVRR